MDFKMLFLKQCYSAAKKSNYYWAGSFVLTLCIFAYYFPSVSVRAELYYENSNNFFAVAWTSNFFEALLKVDNDYLQLFPRIVSLLVVKCGFIKYYPYITQWIGMGFLAFSYSFFNFRSFRTIIQSDVVRFLITLIFPIVLFRDIDYIYFHNAVYGAFIYIPLLFFVQKNNIKNYIFFPLVILVFITLASKIYFIIFQPLFFVAFIFSFYKKQLKASIFYGVCLSTMIPVIWSIFSVFLPQSHQPVLPHNSVSLYNYWHQVLPDISFYFFQLYVHIFVQNNDIFKTYWFVPSFIGMSCLICCLVFLFRKKLNDSAVMFFLLMNFLAVEYLFLTVYAYYAGSLVSGIYPKGTWGDFFIFPHIRHFYFPFVMVFFGTIVVFVNAVKKSVILQVSAIFILGFSLFLFDTPQYVDEFKSDKNSLSQWEYYHHLVYRDQYCIPANPMNHSLLFECSILNQYNNLIVPSTQGQNVIDFVNTPALRTNDWMVSAFLVERLHTDSLEPFYASVKNRDGKEIARLHSLTPADYTYQYFLIDVPQVIGSIEFFTLDNNPVPISQNIYIYGTSKTPLQEFISEPIDGFTIGPFTGPIIDGSFLTQTIISSKNELSGIGFFLGTYARENTCTISVDLMDMETDSVLRSYSGQCNSIKDNAYWNIFFEPIGDSAGKKYRAIIKTHNASLENTVTAYTTPIYKDGADLFVGQTKQINASLIYDLYYSHSITDTDF